MFDSVGKVVYLAVFEAREGVSAGLNTCGILEVRLFDTAVYICQRDSPGWIS